MNFFTLLEARVRAVDSLLCVGLDPRAATVAEVRTECFRLIDATSDYAAIFKPNSAFFEAHGPEGIAVLREVIAHVPAGIPVLLDAKRGDIADTAEAYATAAFEMLGAGALTVNPYLGRDAVEPFLRRRDRGVFVLCKTSNPGADDFQALPQSSAADAPLYEVVARQAQGWNQQGNVGLVLGATDPAAMARVRAIAPDLWFLAPGVGTQGGDLAATLGAGLRQDGLGLLINVSRQLARAADPRAEALRLRNAINAARQFLHEKSPPAWSQLAHDLVTSGCVRFGQFKLKSGLTSPIYMDLRRLVTYPAILRRVAQAYAETLRPLSFDRLAGIPYAALPIATAIALEIDRPLIYPRREAKQYGTRATIEGEHHPGETIAVIDDVTTTGDSKLETIQKLTEAGLTVRDVVVLIDRMQGAGATLEKVGIRLHTVMTLPALLAEWRQCGAITAAQFDEVTTFLAG
jgi:uridine monophosphate synthetase